MKKPASKNENATAKALTHDDIAALAAFRHEVLRFLNFSKEAAEQVGLTPQQYLALLFIEGFSDNGQLTVGELAAQLFVAHHSAVELVNRMESLELIKRCADEKDKRRVSLRLTTLGNKKMRALAELHRRTLSHSKLLEQLRRISE